MQQIHVFLLSSLVLILAGCGSSSSSTTYITTQIDSAVTDIMDYTLVPLAQDFDQQAKTLDTQVNTMCTNPIDATALQAVQAQWVNTSQAWYQILPFKFGPLEGGLDEQVVEPIYYFIDSYRPNGNNYSESVRSDVSTMLAGSTNITNALYANKGFNKVGMLALELVLFERNSDGSKVLSDVVSEFNSESRKCEILSALTNQVLERAGQITQGWTSDYAQTGKSYRDLVVNNELEALVENDGGERGSVKVILAIQDYFDYLKNRDITADMGQVSESIWQSIEASVNPIEEVLLGNEDADITFSEIMISNGNKAALQTVKDNLSTLREAIDEKNTVNFKNAVGLLDGNFKREVPDALNINLGLNFSDGD